MIQCDLVELPKEEDLELRRWLGKGPLALLLRVAQSQQKKECVEAINDAITSKDPASNRYIDAANAHLLEAQRYQTFIDIITKLSEQQAPYLIAKLS